MLGQLIKEEKNANIISISEFAAGLFFIRLFNELGAIIYYDKIVKQ